MLTYLLNVSLTWTVLYVIYKLFLEREKFFKLNRIYLLASLGLGLLLPLISYIPVNYSEVSIITTEWNETYHNQLESVTNYAGGVSQTDSGNQMGLTINWLFVLQIIYFLGLSLVSFKMLQSLAKLKNVYQGSELIKNAAFTEVKVQGNILPFSFLNFIFIGDQYYDSTERQNILKHELFHVQAFHSIDIILMEVLKILFWWNPLVYQYKKSIAENHEFAADEAVLHQSSRKQYCELLMKATFPGVNLELTNPFFQTFVKKRIVKMYQTRSSNMNILKYSFGIIAVLFIAMIFVKPITAQTESSFQIKSSEIEEDKVNKRLGLIEIPVENDKYINENESIVIINEKSNKQNSDVPNASNNDSVLSEGEDKKDCQASEAGIYYNLEITSRLPSCPEGENGRWHAYPILKAFAESNFQWPLEALEEGFTKNLVFNVVVDEKGKLTDILQMHAEPYPFGIEEEGHRIIDLMRKEFTFLPGECNGVAVKTGALFGIKLKIPESKRHLVKIKDSKSIVPKQSTTLGAASSEGNISFGYYSNMNVPISVELINPKGEVVFRDTREYLYVRYAKSTLIEDKINGIYTLKVSQDGLVKESKMDVTVFE